jgi:hypothetical protein
LIEWARKVGSQDAVLLKIKIILDLNGLFSMLNDYFF